MKNSLIIRMYIILLITVLLILGGVFVIDYVISRDTMIDDIHSRAIGVRNYILDNLFAEDLADIGENTEAAANARLRLEMIHERLEDVGNLSRLYVAKVDESGNIITTLEDGFIPTGQLEADLRKSLSEGIAVMGNGIYNIADISGGNDSHYEDIESIYVLFWPVMDSQERVLGTVGMEFDVSVTARSLRQSMIYRLALSGGLLMLISVVAYLSMSRATEPFYKKLAYTDLLSGYENRMAFEHKLRECKELAEQGKNVTILVFDVNNLKTINDTEGHEAGDKYLKNTADIIHDNLHGMAPLYRIGGDEYTVVFADRSESEIEGVIESLRNEKRIAYKKQPFSCAFGAATYNKLEDESLKDTFKRADEAMYIEKKRQKAAGIAHAR